MNFKVSEKVVCTYEFKLYVHMNLSCMYERS
jgi:hypothetical protein